MNSELTFSIVKEILSNNALTDSERADTIYKIVSPLVKSKTKKLSKKTELIIDKIIKLKGYCSRCKSEKIPKSTGGDYCKFCKKSIKNEYSRVELEKILSL